MKLAYKEKAERPRRSRRRGRALRIALAGYGVVGQALAAKLVGDPDFELVAILVRDSARSRAFAPPVALTSDRRSLPRCAGRNHRRGHVVRRDRRVDFRTCLCPAASTSSAPASAWSAPAGPRWSRRPQAGGGRLFHSAAVGGGAPVLETVADARARGEIRSVDGILNGTVNYILERLGRGAGFREALAEARLAGFAEENPAEDLSGADAAAKLRLIAAEAWGCDPSGVAVSAEPLDEAAVERIGASGERWIQLARIERRDGRIVAEVSLRPRRTVETLPHVPDEWNCAAVRLDDGTVFRCRGRGAGGAPTAEAILSDLHRLLDAQAVAPQRSVSC